MSRQPMKTNWEIREMGLESGAASGKIMLSQGHFYMYHGDDDTLLFSGPLPEGNWGKLMDAIIELVPDGTGPMKKSRKG